MSEAAVKSFYSPWQACVIVYVVKELNTFLWIFFLLLLRCWASVVHVPLLVDGLNSERVCDKRVKHSSLASFSGFTTSIQRLFNPWNFLRGKAFFFLSSIGYIFTFNCKEILVAAFRKSVFTTAVTFILTMIHHRSVYPWMFLCVGERNFFDYWHLSAELLILCFPVDGNSRRISEFLLHTSRC